ncbi:MAG: hypothetical protein COT73_05935 [Bdellovibrio sp. CG10_big_fil_rev_8_21_14_0_10_47_8]|nr:MAG: hypothetical protein COT73_05935 [Bdellovibrio sp. CG10_big_fil_rev_8_21_14_0_10_47_8]
MRKYINFEKFVFVVEKIIFPGLLLYSFFQLLSTFREKLDLYWYLSQVVLPGIVIVFLVLNTRPQKVLVSWKVILGLALNVIFASYTFGYISLVSHRVDPYLVTAAIFYCLALILSVTMQGRSFGLMPSWRKVVVKGPYQYLRHPMYSAYIHIGLLIFPLVPRLDVFGAWILSSFGFYLRATEEERLLSQAPEYQVYMARVPRRFIHWGYSAPLIFAIGAHYIQRLI